MGTAGIETPFKILSDYKMSTTKLPKLALEEQSEPSEMQMCVLNP